jgi:hypothetical protein
VISKPKNEFFLHPQSGFVGSKDEHAAAETSLQARHDRTVVLALSRLELHFLE